MKFLQPHFPKGEWPFVTRLEVWRLTVKSAVEDKDWDLLLSSIQLREETDRPDDVATAFFCEFLPLMNKESSLGATLAALFSDTVATHVLMPLVSCNDHKQSLDIVTVLHKALPADFDSGVAVPNLVTTWRGLTRAKTPAIGGAPCPIEA